MSDDEESVPVNNALAGLSRLKAKPVERQILDEPSKKHSLWTKVRAEDPVRGKPIEDEVVFPVRMPRSLRLSLKMLAAIEERSVADILRALVERYVDDNRQKLER